MVLEKDRQEEERGLLICLKDEVGVQFCLDGKHVIKTEETLRVNKKQ